MLRQLFTRRLGTTASPRLFLGRVGTTLTSQQRQKAAMALPSSRDSVSRTLQPRPFPTISPFAKKMAAGLTLCGVAAQYTLGEGRDVFEHKFATTKHTDDLSDFYGTEDFMEIFCVFPFVVKLMMRGAEFDDVGTIHARGLLGSGDLEVSIDFDEKQIDTTGDGELDTVAWFNKREHFEDTSKLLGGLKLWEMTQNFGYHRNSDGTCEVYHNGEYFKGFFPIRLIFQLHAKYVAWATERFINSEAFGSEDDEVDAEIIRQNIPKFAFDEFVAGLTQSVQKAKDATSEDDTERHKQLDVTLHRLSTLRARDASSPIRRIRTVQRRMSSSTLQDRRTTTARVHLDVEDRETRETLRMAMEQIGKEEGGSHKPVQEIRKLTRRVTSMAIDQKEGLEK